MSFGGVLVQIWALVSTVYIGPCIAAVMLVHRCNYVLRKSISALKLQVGFGVSARSTEVLTVFPSRSGFDRSPGSRGYRVPA